jgi:hypothetical protein
MMAGKSRLLPPADRISVEKTHVAFQVVRKFPDIEEGSAGAPVSFREEGRQP